MGEPLPTITDEELDAIERALDVNAKPSKDTIRRFVASLRGERETRTRLEDALRAVVVGFDEGGNGEGWTVESLLAPAREVLDAVSQAPKETP